MYGKDGSKCLIDATINPEAFPESLKKEVGMYVSSGFHALDSKDEEAEQNAAEEAAKEELLSACMRDRKRERATPSPAGEPGSQPKRYNRADQNAQLYSGFGQAADALSKKIEADAKQLEMRLAAEAELQKQRLEAERLDRQLDREMRAKEMQAQMQMQLQMQQQMMATMLQALQPDARTYGRSAPSPMPLNPLSESPGGTTPTGNQTAQNMFPQP